MICCIHWAPTTKHQSNVLASSQHLAAIKPGRFDVVSEKNRPWYSAGQRSREAERRDHVHQRRQ
jgi:hypothetical protein